MLYEEIIIHSLISSINLGIKVQQLLQVVFCNFHLVIPAKVKIDDFLQNDNRERCNDTRRVQWHPLDTGNCLVEYTVEFRNNTNNTIGIVENITKTSYCTSDYNNAKSVVVWATYKGMRGINSSVQFLTATPKSTTPSSTSGTATEEGIKFFKISSTI